MSWQREAQFQSVGPCLIFVCFTSSGTELLRSFSATNCWVRKSACLYNNCQYSGVGSDWGRVDLPNVIFNSLDILHVFVSIFVIRKGPTLFSLLPQSRSSHYPHSEDYRRIAFPPTNIVSIILRLMTSERVQPSFHYFHRVVPLTTLIVRTTGG